METTIIRGEPVRDRILAEVASNISILQSETGRKPCIAFVGFDCVPLARYNIPMHIQMARSAGFDVRPHILPNDSSEEQVFGVIDSLNSDRDVHAVVLLQPLPLHLNPVRIVYRIDPVKEVEGFHPLNMIHTMIPDLQEGRYPMCLPTALKEMFKDEGIMIEPGRDWVFVLDDEFLSNALTRMIVRSAASVVVPRESAVSFVNKEDPGLEAHVRRAGYLVIVSKFPEYLDTSWITEGTCVIDIYSNLLKEVPSKGDPSKLVPVIRGGVNVAAASGKAGALLPIPGGLMTVVLSILFRNTVTAFRNSLRETPGPGASQS